MVATAAAERAPSVSPGETHRLRLNDDGTIELSRMAKGANGLLTAVTHRMVLPTLGQLGAIHAYYQRGNTELAALNERDEPSTDLTCRPNPYAEGLAYALSELAGVEVLAEDLPSWAGRPGALAECIVHWQEVPLDRGTPTPSVPIVPDSNAGPAPAVPSRLANVVR